MVVMIIAMSFVVYKLTQKEDVKSRVNNDNIIVKRVEKRKKKDLSVTKEAVNTLEKSDASLSNSKTEKIKQQIQIPIDYLINAKNQSEIKVSYDNKLSITIPSVAQTIKTMLIAGYHFDMSSLKAFESDSRNVYQFTILLVTEKGDELSVVGNYVTGTEQFEFVSVHGTPVNIIN